MNISLSVLTKNEEKNIRDCILSVRDIVDEIVIVDDYSTDNTVNIAEGLGAKVYKRRLDNFARQRGFLFEKCTRKWILMIDADERLQEELKEEIKKAIEAHDQDGFLILRKNFIFGRYLKFGDNANDWVMRLFKKDKVHIFKPVHEKLKIYGGIERLTEGTIMHYSIADIPSYLKKLNLYTDLEGAAIKKRKFLVLRLITAPVYEFIKRYFFQLGFLDGREGFIYYTLSAFYIFAKYAKAIFD